MQMKVFVDTSAIYAYLSKTDDFHQEAVEKFKKCLDNEWELWIISEVLIETLALIWRRMGKDKAKEAGKWIFENFRIYWVIGDEFKETLEKANKDKLSFVGSFLLYIASNERASVLTFDEKMKSATTNVIFI